jgi:hypothetical protein
MPRPKGSTDENRTRRVCYTWEDMLRRKAEGIAGEVYSLNFRGFVVYCISSVGPVDAAGLVALVKGMVPEPKLVKVTEET